MSVRLHLALSRSLLCAIALWALALCWHGVRQWDGRAWPSQPLAQGSAPSRPAPISKAPGPMGAASAPLHRVLLRSPGA